MTGTAVIDFGAFPGTDAAFVVVSGQTGILATSLVEAWIIPETTAVHHEDEVVMLTNFVHLSVPTSLITPDASFLIAAVCHNDFLWGTLKVGWAWVL